MQRDVESGEIKTESNSLSRQCYMCILCSFFWFTVFLIVLIIVRLAKQ
jgi:hypothetical protein